MLMNIIFWIVLGGLAGWIASMIMGTDARMGAGANIVVGIIGAIIGGLLMNAMGGPGVTGFNLYSILVAIGGAVILLLLVRAFRRV
ncbi:MAG: GlsB/YeaQ/YmgE family stress response membrane protein [Anaerolineales bacterium]